MPLEINIRPYELSDAKAVRELFIQTNRDLAPPELQQAFEAYIERSLKEEIDRLPDYYAERLGGFWVAYEQDCFVGNFGLEQIDIHTAELRRMYVTPSHRRHGIARLLLTHAEQICQSQGYRSLVLSTSELQQAALTLYRKAGYTNEKVEIAEKVSNKTVGGGIRRFHLRKDLNLHA